MKQRLLVMNGQKLVQSDSDGQWVTNKVEKAGAIRPGLYHLHTATPADHRLPQLGVILHVDRSHVYQQVGKAIIAHDVNRFGKTPESGRLFAITYTDGQAAATVASVTHRRGRSK